MAGNHNSGRPKGPRTDDGELLRNPILAVRGHLILELYRHSYDGKRSRSNAISKVVFLFQKLKKGGNFVCHCAGCKGKKMLLERCDMPPLLGQAGAGKNRPGFMLRQFAIDRTSFFHIIKTMKVTEDVVKEVLATCARDYWVEKVDPATGLRYCYHETDVEEIARLTRNPHKPYFDLNPTKRPARR